MANTNTREDIQKIFREDGSDIESDISPEPSSLSSAASREDTQERSCNCTDIAHGIVYNSCCDRIRGQLLDGYCNKKIFPEI